MCSPSQSWHEFVYKADLQNKLVLPWMWGKLFGSTGKLGASFNESFVSDSQKETEGGLGAVA